MSEYKTVEASIEDLAEQLRLVLKTLDDLHGSIVHLAPTPCDEAGMAASVFQLFTLISERVNSNHTNPNSLRASVEDWISSMRIAARRAHPEL